MHRDYALGHSNSQRSRERLRVHDGFSSPLVAVRALQSREHLRPVVWEPAAGLHAIADALRPTHRVLTSDLVRWDPRTQVVRDFFRFDRAPCACDLVTNPPYRRLAGAFALHAWEIMPRGALVCMLLKLSFLEGEARTRELFRHAPPARIHVFSFRLPRMHRFDYRGTESGGTMGFAWFVWEVGTVQEPRVTWFVKPRRRIAEPRRRAVVFHKNGGWHLETVR